jgi:hypothetical protein
MRVRFASVVASLLKNPYPVDRQSWVQERDVAIRRGPRWRSSRSRISA